jgi:pyridoxine/pyridoxamine 5'-phosphate oxidase
MDDDATSHGSAADGHANTPQGEAPGRLLEAAWQRLGRGVADRRAAARHPVLATQGRDGGGEARVVVLRAARRAEGRLEVHTDAASTKVAELAAEPRATLLVWDARAQLQLRLRARVTAEPGPAAAWARMPQSARLAYGGSPPPGAEIPAPEAYAPAAEPDRFTCLACHLTEIEVLELGRDRHRRAVFRRDADWAGRWLAP